ncbi:NDP-hexose 2,3-dehydratase family protein [Streptomyces sp. NPDC057148]|uniref:NDP-hexose 2,3-dehydratase family protein n=1 Tax=unclassified Streptomyces TaxID=2593676 RepID=UPI0036413A60
MTARIASAARRPEPSPGSPALRIARSALATSGHHADLDSFHRWFADCRRQFGMEVRVVPLDSLSGWRTDPATGDLRHESGRFYSVTGLEVHAPGGPVTHWHQPILDQPEVGILGIIAKEFDGVLHFLMQAKNEPGNPGGPQLSPTVQATRSNFTRAHGGSRVPYLDHFLDTSYHQVLVDVRQSEQGAWFYRKRNRNMVVLVEEDIETLDGFCWLTLGQLQRLLAVGDLVNMDARTVLSCLPFAGRGLSDLYDAPADPFTAALVRSCEPVAAGEQATRELLGWLSRIRSECEDHVVPVPLRHVDRWRRAGGRIVHEDGAFFSVMGVTVTATGREVRRWAQPLIEPCGEGVCAFLVRQRDGVLQVLVQAKAQPGFVDAVELAPTVQCTPSNYDVLPDRARPPYLTEVLTARSERIRFATVLAEEGGRFHKARNRYVVVEVDEDHDPTPRPGYRWVTMHQLSALLCHSYYLNVEARSLVACLHALSAGLRPAIESTTRG